MTSSYIYSIDGHSHVCIPWSACKCPMDISYVHWTFQMSIGSNGPLDIIYSFNVSTMPFPGGYKVGFSPLDPIDTQISNGHSICPLDMHMSNGHLSCPLDPMDSHMSNGHFIYYLPHPSPAERKGAQTFEFTPQPDTVRDGPAN